MAKQFERRTAENSAEKEARHFYENAGFLVVGLLLSRSQSTVLTTIGALSFLYGVGGREILAITTGTAKKHLRQSYSKRI